MKKRQAFDLFAVFALILSLVLALASCNTGDENNGDEGGENNGGEAGNENNGGDGGDEEPDPNAIYDITFWVDGTEYVVKTKAGEIPVFTGDTSKPMTESTVYTFVGWNKELAMATENTTYVANYTSAIRKYTVTYLVDGKTVGSESVDYATAPTPPQKVDGKSVLWLDISNITGDTTIEGLPTVLDSAMASWAYNYSLMNYVGNYDRSGDVEAKGSALLYLALGEYREKSGGVIRDKILESVRFFIKGGNEPGFNAGPNHSYPPVAFALAVIRHTPTVWDQLTAEEQAKLDLIMECFAISTAFVTDDENYYRTGPALTGNYYKTWNPNHRHAMTLPIVAATIYFSAGGADGADYVNGVLQNFDYDSYIAKFDKYGFVRAKYHWTAGGFTADDGTYIPSSKELMMNGGTAYVIYADNSDADHTVRTLLDAPTNGGYGVGVRGNTYSYHGIGLDNIGGILRNLYSVTYSGGAVISDSSTLANGTGKDGKPLAYIIDGSKSPVEGELGMMAEFCAGDGGGLRSSASYNTHNFASVVQSLSVAGTLGYWELSVDDELFKLMWIGNTDLIYKNEVGYLSYSLGQPVGPKSDKNYPYYLPWKAWWLENFGDAITLTRDINYVMNGSSAEGLTVEYERSDNEQIIELPTPIHSVNGVTFRGWYLDAAGTKTQNSGVAIANGKLTLSANHFSEITLHAIFTYPEGVTPKPIVYHTSKEVSIPDSAPTVFYDMGQSVTVPLPTPVVVGDFLGWYLSADLSGAPLGDSLTLTAEQAANMDKLELYPKYRRAIYQQTPGLLESISKTPGTIKTTLAEDGSDYVTAKIPAGSTEVALDTGKKLSFKTEAITLKMTISGDNKELFPSFGVRLRGASNTSNFMTMDENGTISVCGTALGAKLSTDPTELVFIFRDHPTNTTGATMIIDVYVNGKLVANDLEYAPGSGYSVADIIRLYILFGSKPDEDITRSMYIKDLTIYDGEAIPEA